MNFQITEAPTNEIARGMKTNDLAVDSRLTRSTMAANANPITTDTAGCDDEPNDVVPKREQNVGVGEGVAVVGQRPRSLRHLGETLGNGADSGVDQVQTDHGDSWGDEHVRPQQHGRPDGQRLDYRVCRIEECPDSPYAKDQGNQGLTQLGGIRPETGEDIWIS